MKLVVFTNPVSKEGEFALINQMFKAGLECLHLRKPGLEKQEYMDNLRQINPSYLKKVVLHDHLSLVEKYNVKGFYLSRKYLQNLSTDSLQKISLTAKKRSLTMACGAHKLNEIDALDAFDNVFLSPVFDSISKPDHLSTMDLTEVAFYLKNTPKRTEVFALGGVKPEHLPLLKKAGFNGIAVLGAIWTSSDPFAKFIEIQTKAVA